MQGGLAAVLVGFNDIFQVDVLHVRMGVIFQLVQDRSHLAFCLVDLGLGKGGDAHGTSSS
ncbi:hypothetical protein D3C71_1745630 [compost metagenome]